MMDLSRCQAADANAYRRISFGGSAAYAAAAAPSSAAAPTSEPNAERLRLVSTALPPFVTYCPMTEMARPRRAFLRGCAFLAAVARLPKRRHVRRKMRRSSLRAIPAIHG